MRALFFPVVAALILLWAAWPGPVAAHNVKLSASRLTVGERGVDAELTLNLADLEAALGVGRRPEAAAIAAYVTARATVRTREDVACVPEVQPPKAATGGHVLLNVAWRCPAIHGGLVYRVTLFQELDSAARHMVVFADGSGRLVLLGMNAREVDLAGARAVFREVVARYLVAGIEHISIGFDHIAFVLAIILWGRRPWPLFKIVTAFTLAHSVTLSLAVLGVVSLPSRWVEAIIAASIVYVAVENFFIRDVDKRWRLSFLFGLVHGFGFAGALRQFGLPDQAIVPALASFNLGVEIGQLAIVVTALSVLYVLDRVTGGGRRDPRVVYVFSGLIFLLGMYWLAERTILA
jgi:hydrogenase/urease accessory protein HupE